MREFTLSLLESCNCISIKINKNKILIFIVKWICFDMQWFGLRCGCNLSCFNNSRIKKNYKLQVIIWWFHMFDLLIKCEHSLQFCRFCSSSLFSYLHSSLSSYVWASILIEMSILIESREISIMYLSRWWNGNQNSFCYSKFNFFFHF